MRVSAEEKTGGVSACELSGGQGRRALASFYMDRLLNDTVPFWFPRAVDRECGGFFTSFDRDGTLVESDKPIWLQGRFSWMLATLYNTVERREEWLAFAKSGVEFLDRHGFDADGRMFFTVTREGRPLRKRERYVFSEAFAVIGYAAYGTAACDGRYVDKARELFGRMLATLQTPGVLKPKTDPRVRPMKGLSVPMILLVTAQELREATDDPRCGEVIERCLAEIERDFLKPEFRCLLETVGPDGEFYDTFDGRLVNPGHSIEVAWFILAEALRRNGDARLVRLGTTILDWSWSLGWDRAFGGIRYFCDARGLPCAEYCHDMKFWWPQTEALVATLLAYRLTGDAKYAEWHRLAHVWAHQRFSDPVFGEWFGYLHRDGTPSTTLKGNVWKGFFHLPRMQWMCWRLLEDDGKGRGR
jgi:N-acylglucosamine 2-epimerase